MNKTLFKKQVAKPIVGIIGGMGPAATLLLQQYIIEATDVACDQDHLNIIVHNNSTIPDRTKSLRENDGQAFVDAVVASGKKLYEAGASVVCMPCNTAHARLAQIKAQLPIPIVDMVSLAVRAVSAVADKVADKARKNIPVLILGTDGTLESGVYKRHLNHPKIVDLPIKSEDQSVIMDIIYEIKTGKNNSISRRLFNIIEKITCPNKDFGSLSSKTKQDIVVVLACTELSIYAQELRGIGITIVDPLKLLAEYLVRCYK